MPFFVAGWILVGVAWMLYLRRRDPRKLQLIGQIVFLDIEPPTAVTAPAGNPPPAGPDDMQPSPG